MSLTRDAFAAWLDAYVAAWRSNDASDIGRLFSEDVTYSYRAGTEVVNGRDAVVADWLATLTVVFLGRLPFRAGHHGGIQLSAFRVTSSPMAACAIVQQRLRLSLDRRAVLGFSERVCPPQPRSRGGVHRPPSTTADARDAARRLAADGLRAVTAADGSEAPRRL
jgi:hypothetical protein